MKKFVWLFSIALTLIVVLNVVAYYLKESVVSVETILLSPVSEQNTVVCSGKVEYAESKEVYAKSSTITDKIFVKVGDKVNKGDILLSAYEASASAQPTMGGTAAANEVPDLGNLGDLQELYSSFLNGGKAQNVLSTNYVRSGEKFDVKAPISGVVSSINVKEQEGAAQSKALMVISDISKLQVRLSVNESQIADIAVGQKASITGVGFRDSEYSGVVASISNEAEQVVNTMGKETVVNVLVSVDTAGEDIRPGFTAKCKIITSEDSQTMVVPYESVRSDEDGKEYVYQYRDGHAVKTFITTGKEYQSGFQVLDGVEVGDRIISTPDIVSDDSRVRLAEISVVA